MKRLYISRTIDAPAADAWKVLVDLARWPDWGPSVRSATLGGAPMQLGSRGTVTTSVGVALAFQVTDFEPGRCWSWKVAGIPATGHSVEPLGAGRCRVTFGVPAIAWPYLIVCRVALERIAVITENLGGTSQ
jgi:hypothetical protein